MADGTLIEWARHPVTGKGATWNVINGCSLVSEGCRHCYAARLAATRMKTHPTRTGLARLNAAGEAKFTGEVRFNEKVLTDPLRWRAPRGIFVCAHGDLFHEAVLDEWIDRVFAVMALAPQHVFFVLTKRPERARSYLAAARDRIGEMVFLNALRGAGVDAEQWRYVASRPWPLPNVWLGTSVEDQATADARIPHLLAAPAAIRFVSAEPLLGPVDLRNHRRCDQCGNTPAGLWAGDPLADRSRVWESDRCPLHYWPDDGCDGTLRATLDWVIVGGESGPHARPMHPDWPRGLRDQCSAAGKAFLFKQWGEWTPGEYANHAPTRTEETAAWFGGQWHYTKLSPKASEETHIDDAPDLYRVGKKRAGRLLDGVVHDAMPETAA